MTNLALCRAVAGATGESLHAVRRLGFQPMRLHPHPHPRDHTLVVRCPFCGAIAPLPSAPDASLPEASCDGCGVAFDYEPGEVRLARRPAARPAPRRPDLARLV